MSTAGRVKNQTADWVKDQTAYVFGMYAYAAVSYDTVRDPVHAYRTPDPRTPGQDGCAARDSNPEPAD
jgi:hypothetical protein